MQMRLIVNSNQDPPAKSATPREQAPGKCAALQGFTRLVNRTGLSQARLLPGPYQTAEAGILEHTDQKAAYVIGVLQCQRGIGQSPCEFG
jgi:hypothetical protein